MTDQQQSNVVQLHNARCVDPQETPSFPQESELYFEAIECSLSHSWNDSNRDVKTHKALVRPIHHDIQPHNPQPRLLNVVGIGYKVVQNRELFQAVEAQFMQSFNEQELRDVHVQDKMSYHGAQCMREYIFPNVRCPIEGRRVSEIAFRTIVVNGFGGSSIRVLTGAIDFFCANGMVLGEFDTMYARHTSGLQIGNITSRIKRAVDVFYKQADRWSQWMRKTITYEEAADFYKSQFSERLADKLARQYLIEAQVHGANVWALYSALTYYASHDEGDFAVRKTDNDHTAATLLTRERSVRKATYSEDFQRLAA